MSTSSVRNLGIRLTADRELDLNDAEELVAEVGGTMSSGEARELFNLILAPKDEYVVGDDAQTRLLNGAYTTPVRDGDNTKYDAFIKRYQKASALLSQMERGEHAYLSPEQRANVEKAILKDNNLGGAIALLQVYSGESFAKTTIPPAVVSLVEKTVLAGAEAYDVREVRRYDTKTENGETFQAPRGMWSPYPQAALPYDSLRFDYTMITPEKLEEDAKNMADPNFEYTIKTGTRSYSEHEIQEQLDELRSFGYYSESDIKGFEKDLRETRLVTTEKRQGSLNTRGGASISSAYDEAVHEDVYARGQRGQKWANNFAILADGSVHCLPASRRSQSADVVLTCPSLARSEHMLYNGHLDVREGVVVGVEMSGRLAKRAAEGKTVFIDPIAVLKAWGFEVADNVNVRFSNRAEDGTEAIVDPSTQTIRAPS